VLKTRVNPYVVLLLGALPDMDLFFASFGVQHRTVTHSLIFWPVVFIPVFVKYRKQSIPYFVALTQHIVLGDLIVNYVKPFWPISSVKLGLGLNLMSLGNIVIEIAGLIIFLMLLRFKGDYKLMFGVKKHNLLSIAPLIPLVMFLLVAQNVDPSLILGQESAIDLSPRLGNRIMLNNFLPVIVVAHLVLACSLVISLVQGSRAVIYKSAV
jgi:membrane-bound metal-dependent hydrolase YbcI (DUF457 family)